MKCLLVYQSKSGYTKRYMEMLAEQIEATVVELKSVNPAVFSEFEAIVFAGGVYAGKISGIKKFVKSLGRIIDKKLAVIAVGASPGSQALRDKLMTANLASDMAVGNLKLEFFYLQGGFDPEKLNYPLKTMLKMVSKGLQSKQLKNPESLTQGDREFLEFFQTVNDHTSAIQLQPIIQYLCEAESVVR